MIKLLSIISLILALVLFPPAALAFISNNAVPGDATYPIKRALENVVVAVASVNPKTRAWFSQTRSDTRFKEFSALIAQGKKTTNTLNELVEQTDIAVSQISQVTDSAEKAKLIEQLSQSIDKYDQGLQKFTSEPPASAIAQNLSTPEENNSLTTGSTSQATALPAGASTTGPNSARVIPQPSSAPLAGSAKPATVSPSPVAKSTTKPTPTPTPKVQASSKPSSSPLPSPVKTLTPTPQPTPDSKQKEAEIQKQKEIEAAKEARKRLQETKKKLEEESAKKDDHQSGEKNKDSNLTPKNNTDKKDDSNKKRN